MPRPFLETLGELRAGKTLQDLGDELAQLLVAIKATGKAGVITLTLKLKPPKNGSMSYITIADEISVKTPKLDKGDTVFFPTVDNGLSRRDPTQPELPFKRPVVDEDTGEIKEETA